jgi:hypothetical protein
MTRLQRKHAAQGDEEAVFENMAKGTTVGEAYSNQGDTLVVSHTSRVNHLTTVNAATLAQHWGMSIQTAANTVKSSVVPDRSKGRGLNS